MKLTVQNDAAQWYRQQLELEDGDYVRFFAQVYGSSIHPNFSLGIKKEPPHNMAIHTTVEGITFYFEEADAWFLDEYTLTVALTDDEVDFIFNDL